MKKFLTLIFGLLIACVAVYAVPKEIHDGKVQLKNVLKIETSYDVVAPVIATDIQVDVDDGVLESDMIIKESIGEVPMDYIIKNEGVPLAGFRRWYPDHYQCQFSISSITRRQTNSAARAKGDLKIPL